jgi:hypothetical protein
VTTSQRIQDKKVYWLGNTAFTALNEGKEVFDNFVISVHLDAKSISCLSAVKAFFVKHLEDAAR